MSCQYTSVAILIAFIFLACQGAEQPITAGNTEGTERMNDSIKMIYDHQTNFYENTYENDKRVDLFKAILKEADTDINNYFKLAIEYLNNGQTEKAIETSGKISSINPAFRKVTKETLVYHKFLGICYLRLAEQSNCIHNHNDESCIVPIEGGGIHIDKSGSEQAIDKYLEILTVDPTDMESRWLLNLAYMTLGMHPEEVPEEYLIPLPEQRPTIPRMENIATKTGLDHDDLSGGVITDDFNNDGLLDIIISSWSFSGKITYYQNNAEQGFEDVSEASGLANVIGGLNIKQADYNNDGHIDFVILRGAWKPNEDWGIPSNSLMKNNGDGTFSDVTFEAGMYSRRPTQSAEWLDFNNDGLLDLFIANETTKSSRTQFPCEFYKNNGDGTFTDVAGKYNVDLVGYFKGVTSGDINNDGWPELFLSNLYGDNILLLNEYYDKPSMPFINIAKEAGVQLPFAAFPAWFFDCNSDGWDDIYVASYGQQAFMNQAGQFANDMLGKEVQTESNRLFLNQGNLKFRDVTDNYFDMRSLSTMGCNFGDVNNDGFPDFYLGTGAPDYRAAVPNRFFTNIDGNRYEDQTFALGVGHIQKGHGISFADLDNDGDQDVYAVMGGAFKGDNFSNVLFENPGNSNKWIRVRLQGVESNRSAIGSKIRVHGITEDGDSIIVYKTVNSGASFGGNSLTAQIGLSNITEIVSLKIMWPNGSGKYTEYGPVAMNSAYFIKEGQSPEGIPVNTFQYNKNKKRGHHHHHNSN